jgi:antitoxin (DNA-binding transcriptional repressor) of toxin-antitoxin stability system
LNTQAVRPRRDAGVKDLSGRSPLRGAHAPRGLFIERTIWYKHLMTTITLQKAQQGLAVLIKRALAGEEIVIEADSRKVRLAPVPALPVFDAATARRRGYGSMKGQFEFTDAFFEPLPADELKSWEGRDIE